MSTLPLPVLSRSSEVIVVSIAPPLPTPVTASIVTAPAWMSVPPVSPPSTTPPAVEVIATVLVVIN